MIRKNICKSTKKALRGMTLIELMIAIAILGILAAVVYPNYTQHIQTSHRATAKADLVRLQLILEQSYSATGYRGGYDFGVIDRNTAYCAASKVKCDSDSARYSFRIEPLTMGKGYKLTAIPTGAQADDKCSRLTLSSNGDATPAACW